MTNREYSLVLSSQHESGSKTKQNIKVEELIGISDRTVTKKLKIRRHLTI